MSTPSVLLIPDLLKAGKLYSQIPNSGDVDFSVTRATTAFRTNASGILESVANNVPRLDYPIGGGCPSLLVEPAATNVALNSETFGASVGTTIVLNNTTSPDGAVTADKLVEDTSTGIHRSGIAGALGGSVDSSVYSVSVFAKAAGRTRLNMFDNNQVADGNTNFDIANGVVIGGTGKIENYGNGWYRCTIFPAKTNSTNFNCHVRLIDSGTNVSYTGNGTSGVFLWGKQVETGSVATSYIPTVAATATRNADVISKTGVSGFIGQTEGTLYIDFNYNQPTNDANGRLLQIYATNDTTNSILPLILGAGANVNQFQLTTFSGGISDIPIAASAATIVPFGQNKFAIAYNAGVYTVYRNGSLFASGTSLAPASFTAINLGASLFAARSINNRIRAAAIYPTRLTNSELSSLTTL
jgi:hypothetical protein